MLTFMVCTVNASECPSTSAVYSVITGFMLCLLYTSDAADD